MLATVNTQPANTAESVASIAELALINETPLTNGHIVWHRTLRDQYFLEKTSTVAIDAHNVVQGTISDTRWVRVQRANAFWWLQDFTIDPIGGNDESIGTSAAPLKTDVELFKRWGKARLATPRTVTYLSNPSTQTNYDIHLLPGGALTLLGTRTQTKTSTITAVTVQDRTTNIPWDITASGLGAADVGNLVRLTGGANVGAYARIVKDLTGGKVRVTPFGVGTSNPSAPFTVATPAVGDTIEVVTLTTLGIGYCQFNASGLASTIGPVNSVVFDSVVLDTGASALDGMVVANTVKIFYLRSLLSRIKMAGNAAASGHTVGGGGADAVNILPGASPTLLATGLMGTLTLQSGATPSLQKDCLFQAAKLSALAGCRGVSQGIAFFDCSADAALFVNAGAIVQQATANADWGTANAGHGVVVQSGGSYVYATKPIVNTGLGAGREAKVGGTDKLWTTIPYFEPLNGAQISLQQ